jgi:hypothetical protein
MGSWKGRDHSYKITTLHILMQTVFFLYYVITFHPTVRVQTNACNALVESFHAGKDAEGRRKPTCKYYYGLQGRGDTEVRTVLAVCT